MKFENQIEFIDRSAYYLLNDAALLDLNIPIHLNNELKANAFVHFANPDFAKTLIVEGGAVSLNDVYEVKHSSHEKSTNLLHLVGNGSFLSFLGFVSKLKVLPNQFPMKWSSIGKIYSAKNTELPGLFGSAQSTAVQVFLADKTTIQSDESYNNTIKIIEDLYKSLDIHFRIVKVSADKLTQPESRKVCIEMFSSNLQKYIEVGHLSDYSDYMSKRLLFCYDEKKKNKFPFLCGGTVMNVSRVLAILLESNKGNISHFKSLFCNKN